MENHLDITSVPTKYFVAEEMIKFFEMHQVMFVKCALNYSAAEQKIKIGIPAERSIDKFIRKLTFCATVSDDYKFIKEFIPIANDEICREVFEEFGFIMKNAGNRLNMQGVRALKDFLNEIF